MIKNKLKPCPFCGGKAKMYRIQDTNRYMIMCIGPTCVMCVQTSKLSNRETLVKQWNTRKPMERIAGQLERQTRLIDAEKIDFNEVFPGNSDCAREIRAAAQGLIVAQPTVFDYDLFKKVIEERKRRLNEDGNGLHEKISLSVLDFIVEAMEACTGRKDSSHENNRTITQSP